MEKSTISIAIFNSYVSHNQRVNLHFPMVFLWFSYGFCHYQRVATTNILPHEVLPAPCSPCPGPVRMQRAGRTNLLEKWGASAGETTNGHWNREFSHENSMVIFHSELLVYQRVYILVGGFSPYPSEKWWSEFVSWDLDMPNIWKVTKAMFQTTNQI